MSNSWFTRLNPFATALHKGTQKRQKSQPTVGNLESLEERVVPAVYLITGTADGAGTVTASNTPGIDFTATTLRGAILAANASVGVADTINLPGGMYALTLTGASEDAAETGDLDITGDLTISGSGNVTIDGNNSDRVIQVISGNVTLSGVTVEHGLTSGAGGGVLVSGGQLTLLSSLITSNSSQGLDATVAFGTGGSGLGGGLAVTGGSAALINSTVSNNTAIGGMAIVGGEGFGGSAFGGGVYAGSNVTVENSTIAFNSVTRGQGASTNGSAAGGGIYRTAIAPAPIIGSTIIAKNTSPSVPSVTDTGGAGGASFTSEGFNLIGVAAGNEGFSSATDLAGTPGTPLDPGFMSTTPANYGGLTPTLSLAINSPAVDAGKNLSALADDQRGAGFVRTFDQSHVTNATGGDGTDIGAYESSDLHLVVDITTDEDDGNYLVGHLSLREAINLSNINAGADTISFAPAVEGQVFDISIGQTVNGYPAQIGESAFIIAGEMTIQGSGEVIRRAGSDSLPVDALSSLRAFVMFPASDLTLQNLTIKGFAVRGGAPDTVEQGGDGQTATGGAIFGDSSTLTVENCLLTGNSAIGGPSNVDSQIGTSGSGLGGAIAIESGTITIINSTLSGNSAVAGSGVKSGSGVGGAIATSGSILVIKNSTLTQNVGADGGRQVFDLTAESSSGPTYFTQIDNSILGQSDTDVTDYESLHLFGGTPDIRGSNNLIRTQTGFPTAGIVSTADPLLGPLQNNGGLTMTHAVLVDSPVINAGDNSLVPLDVTTDQRGTPYARQVGTVDLGAFERQDNQAPSITDIRRETPTGSITNATSVTFQISFTEDVTNVDTGDFTSNFGTVSNVTPVDASHYDVTISGLSGVNGTVTLSVSANQEIKDLADNVMTTTTPTGTVQTYVLDHSAPIVLSIVRQDPTSSLVDETAVAVTFRVTFSEDVQNVNAADFAVNLGAVSTVTSIDADTYDVEVMTLGGTNGVLSLSLANPQDVQDLATNALTNTTPSGVDETYLLDHTAPAFTTSATPSIVEGTTDVLLIMATDLNGPVTFSVSGGVDQDLFTLTSGGQLSFKSGPIFDLAGDANGDHVYEIQVQAFDAAGNSSFQNLQVTVTFDAFLHPVIHLSNVTADYHVTKPAFIDSAATYTPLNNPNLSLSGAVLRVSISNGSTKDSLKIAKKDTVNSHIKVKGHSVVYNDTIVGTFTGGKKGQDLVITLNSQATATAVDNLLRRLTFAAKDQLEQVREVKVQISKISGNKSSNLASRSIEVLAKAR